MFSSMANWSIDKIDHEMAQPMDWCNNEKIVGILIHNHYDTDKSKEEEIKELQKCDNYEELIVGILNNDISLVKSAFASDNITKKEAINIVIEKADGSKSMAYFFPELEAKERNHKEILDFIQKQPEPKSMVEPIQLPPGGINLDAPNTIKNVDPQEIIKNIDYYEMKKTIKNENGEKIVGIVSFLENKTDEEKLKEIKVCEDYEKLIVGIFNNDINLVKSSLASGNITKTRFTQIVIEKSDGSKRLDYIQPDFEAKRRNHIEIMGFIKECFVKQEYKHIFESEQTSPDLKSIVDRVDYDIKKPIDWKDGGKIIGVIKPSPDFWEQKEDTLRKENKHKDFKNLIAGILTEDINLVKLALEPGNITKMDGDQVAVEKNGAKELDFFFPINEANAKGNKEIIDYMKSFFANQPEKTWGFAIQK